MMEGVNSSMMYLIYRKNICKCHHVPIPSTTIKKEKRKKLIIEPSYGPEIPLFGTYSKEVKSGSQRHMQLQNLFPTFLFACYTVK
jgi:hypothetical protein